MECRKSDCVFWRLSFLKSDPNGRAVYGVGLRPLACWDCWFESRRRHACLFPVNVVCCAGRGICVRPILRPGGSYRLCVCIAACDQVQQNPLTPTVST